MLKHETFKEKNLKRQGDLEMSGNLTAVRVGNVMDFFYQKSGKCQGHAREKILSGKSCLKLFIVSCIFASIQVFSTSTGMI